MRFLEDKACYNSQETPNSSTTTKNGASSHHHHHHRTTMGKPTPSKWDDAQKWLVGLSKGGGEKSQSKNNKPRNSNADDLRLIAPVPQKEQEEEEEEEYDGCIDFTTTGTSTNEAETKKVECEESIWRSNNNNNMNNIAVQSICFRDMGTEMTPIASQEPSRTATPIRATTPATRSPIHSGTSTPMRGENGLEQHVTHEAHNVNVSSTRSNNGATREGSTSTPLEKKVDDHGRDSSTPLESRATAWDEAERAKYMARFKREEVKIQAWENHQVRKAEMEMKKMEVKAERMKALAQERLSNKLAATRRIAEEKRANAQVKLNEKALRTTERADYIRRTGHVPSSFSFTFKLPSLCW